MFVYIDETDYEDEYPILSRLSKMDITASTSRDGMHYIIHSTKSSVWYLAYNDWFAVQRSIYTGPISLRYGYYLESCTKYVYLDILPYYTVNWLDKDILEKLYFPDSKGKED